MGRFLFIIGLILMIVGFVGPMFSLGSMFGGMDSLMGLATDNDAREAELCEEDEELDEITGSSTYTMGQGHASSVTMYCVDEEGNRREVTGDFVEGLFGDDFFGGISNTIGQTFLFVGASVIGIFLMIIGMFMSLGAKRKGMMVMNPYNASINMNPNPMQPPMNQAGWGSPVQNTPQAQGLTAQLQELERAYQQNLISREEYDTARQKLLNG